MAKTETSMLFFTGLERLASEEASFRLSSPFVYPINNTPIELTVVKEQQKNQTWNITISDNGDTIQMLSERGYDITDENVWERVNDTCIVNNVEFENDEKLQYTFSSRGLDFSKHELFLSTEIANFIQTIILVSNLF